eukprot:6803483-Alexandrium_andersonii.AAC.1
MGATAAPARRAAATAEGSGGTHLRLQGATAKGQCRATPRTHACGGKAHACSSRDRGNACWSSAASSGLGRGPVSAEPRRVA